MYVYTRVDPCIKCTRSKLDTGQGVLGLVAPEDLLSVFCLVLPLVLSSVVLSPLVSSCLGFSALVSSCVVCWASPVSPLAGPGGPWAPLGVTLALGSLLARPWAAPGLSGAVLAASWASFGASWAALGRRKRVFTKPCKNFGFCMVSEPFGGLLAPPLGGSWLALGPS